MMSFFLKTPKTKFGIALLILSVVAYLIASEYGAMAQGRYSDLPSDADSMGLGVLWMSVGALLVSVPYILILFIITPKYQGAVSLLFTSKKVISNAVASLYGVPFLLIAYSCAKSLATSFWIGDVGAILLCIWAFSQIRAIVITGFFSKA